MEFERKQILLDRLRADLAIEEARLRAKKENAYMISTSQSAYEISVSKEVVKEIEKLIKKTYENNA